MSEISISEDIKNLPINIINTINTKIDWSSEHELILVEWADKALCYRWLHNKSNIKYSRMNTWFTIPVIIMSTLTGTANFAQEQIDIAYRSYATMAIGAVNLLAGIITTVQQFLKISELNESHRVAAIAWGKFYRNIKIELTKTPLERMEVLHLLKISKEEFDRLMETSPAVSYKIIDTFKSTFSGGDIKYNKEGVPINLTPKQANYLEIIKPELCDSLETTAKSIFKGTPTIIKQFIPINNDNTSLKDRENEKEREHKRIIEQIKNFIIKFEKEMKRMPVLYEINDNLDEIVNQEIIKQILDEVISSRSTALYDEYEA